MGSKLHNAKEAVFNAANLNAVAAMFLSEGIGSRAGTAIFAMAILAGSYNKYRSLTKGADALNDEGAFQGFLEGNPEIKKAFDYTQAQLKSPALTANILMLAAFYNCMDASWDTFAAETGERTGSAYDAIIWGFGTAGDNALRKLDKVNFSQTLDGLKRKGSSALRASFNIMGANPTLYYNGAATVLAVKLLQDVPLSSSVGIVGAVSIAALVAGVGRSFWNTAQVVKGQKTPDKIHDGFLNVMTAGSAFAQSVLAGVTGNTPVMISQAIFTAATVKILYETRSALGKEGVVPMEKPKPPQV